MKTIATATAAFVLACAGVTAVQAQTMPTRPGSNPSAITISCFRGPSSSVIWDRPNAVFVEDLVRVGYSYPEAHAIGERVCRDEYGVGNHEHMRTSLLNIMASTPVRR